MTSVIFLAVDFDVARLVPGLLIGPGGVAARTHVGKPEDRGGLVLEAGAHAGVLLQRRWIARMLLGRCWPSFHSNFLSVSILFYQISIQILEDGVG